MVNTQRRRYEHNMKYERIQTITKTASRIIQSARDHEYLPENYAEHCHDNYQKIHIILKDISDNIQKTLYFQSIFNPTLLLVNFRIGVELLKYKKKKHFSNIFPTFFQHFSNIFQTSFKHFRTSYFIL